ncbi:MAG: hypothetical protein LUG98_06420, partial [Tannerellaceae bacterium]|nr:hypothetical protein [Tannerellaceae bacterium]
DISSLIQYTYLPQRLDKKSDNNDFNSQQKIYQKGLYSNTSSYITINHYPSIWRIQINIETTADGLETDLNKISLQDSIYNNLKTNAITAKITPSYSYNDPGQLFKLNISLPTSYQYLHVQDKQFQRQNQYSYLYISPNTRINYRLSPLWETALSYRWNHTRGDIRDYLNGYLLTGYRNLIRKNGIQRESRNHSLSFRINFRNPIRGIFFYTNLVYMNRKNNLLSSQEFSTNIITTSGNIEQMNQQNTWLITGYFAKYLHAIRTNIAMNIQYNIATAQKEQQHEYTHQSENYTFNPSLNTEISKHISLNYSGKLIRNALKIGNKQSYNTKTITHQFMQELSAYLFPSSKTEIKVKGEYIYNEISSSASSGLFFIDFGMSYKLKQIEMNFTLNNLLNQKEYSYTVYNGLDTYYYHYRLRERSFLTTIIFSY